MSLFRLRQTTTTTTTTTTTGSTLSVVCYNLSLVALGMGPKSPLFLIEFCDSTVLIEPRNCQHLTAM